MSTPAIVIAGTHSGCGKTTVALGIMAALAARGCRVQPFKVGPDFIDPGHHAGVTGRASHNLDGWMLDEPTNRGIFARYAADADVAVVEGVMGLFDGFSGRDEAGSTAQMAKWLRAPVVLVADARSMARSAAALVQGYARFDPELPFAGTVLNRVGSAAHKDILAGAMESAPGTVYGYLPREGGLEIPSRHLGLVTEPDLPGERDRRADLVRWTERNLDLDSLLRDARAWSAQTAAQAPGPAGTRTGAGPTIAVARDEAFCFYYGENLRLLQEAGARLAWFSPLRDKRLPAGAGGLYLGGGYPELHCERLAGNRALLQAVRGFAAAGGPVYAECGGFMYLMREIRDLQGASHPMAGIFPFAARMEQRFRALGYREVRLEADCFLGCRGTRIRGHEFHYSGIEEKDRDAELVYAMTDRRGREIAEGYRAGSVLGSYVHLHWGSCPEAAQSFVRSCG
jgi:cobyrinic acid a,c-diamide synthase